MEVFWWNMVDRGISADFGDSEFDASASALRFVCGSGIELTRAHNLLVYEGQSEYVQILTI